MTSGDERRPVIDPGMAGSDQSVSVAYVASILPAVAARYGLDAEALLQQAGFEREALGQSQAMVPLVDVLRLFLLVLERTGDQGLGFEAGRQVMPRSYQVLGYAILSSSTVAQAISRLIHFEKLVGNLGHTELARRDDIVRLTWHCPVVGDLARYLTEAAVTGWITLARQLVQDAPRPSRVCFPHSAPPRSERYPDYFGCPVEFDADFSGVEFQARYLDLPLQGADPGLGDLMEREARALLADYDGQTNLVAAVRREVYHLLVEGEPGVEAVARKLGLAERTLQARLRKQGFSFQQVVDNLRRTLADIYMRDRRLSLTDISLLLGFAEQSSFTRAFRRWHGESPAQARQRLP